MPQRYKVQPAIARKRDHVDLGPSEREWVFLGKLAEVGPKKSVRLGLDHEHVVAIVGKRGSGKSFTLGSFLEGLCTAERETPLGVTEHRRAGLLFDTLNIFQWMTSDASADTASAHVAAQRRDLEKWGLGPTSSTSICGSPPGSRVASPQERARSASAPTRWRAGIGRPSLALTPSRT
ncbi:hypothetical protein ACE2AJ_14610 [Aquihabitans daechungensis]|uniref:hypothetical protein n=1 Tax=Aquihabitans daechungensis TaxID=1052257 RepID=UPI003B9F6F24